MKDNIIRIKSMGKESLLGLMDDHMMENSKMDDNMG